MDEARREAGLKQQAVKRVADAAFALGVLVFSADPRGQPPGEERPPRNALRRRCGQRHARRGTTAAGGRARDRPTSVDS